MNKIPTLNVIDGDYGLVSLDIACIQSILYAKVYKIPVEINLVNTLKSCALYSAPSLKCDNGTISKFPNIMIYWDKGRGVEVQQHQLNAKQKSETLAIMNLVSMKLKPVLDYIYWVDQRNCEEFINRWFMSALPFPFNYSYTKRKKAEALQLIETLYPLDTDIELIKEFITKSATQCLQIISTRLGKAKFFYGENPDILDVIVYAHIAPIIKLPFPSNDIPSLLSMWPNLSDFVKRIDAKYFSNLKKDIKYLRNEENVRQNNDDEVSYMAIFILAISATSLVIGFAYKRGFLNLSY